MTSERRHHPILGITFVLAGTVFIATADALGKWLTAGYPVVQVAWIRTVCGLLIIGGFAIATGRVAQLRPQHRGWHLFRSVLSTALVLLVFYGLKHLPLAEYAAIAFAAPFIVAMLSPRLLGEPVGAHTWLAIALGFAGVLLIFRPAPGHFEIAHLTTLGLATAGAVLVITARRLSTSETALALNFYVYPFSILVLAYPAAQAWVEPSPLDWCLFAALGSVATAGMGCIIHALRLARPAFIAPFDYVRLMWTIMLGYAIWGEVPRPATWAGIVTIVLAGIYVVSHGRAIPELGAQAGSQTD